MASKAVPTERKKGRQKERLQRTFVWGAGIQKEREKMRRRRATCYLHNTTVTVTYASSIILNNSAQGCFVSGPPENHPRNNIIHRRDSLTFWEIDLFD